MLKHILSQKYNNFNWLCIIFSWWWPFWSGVETQEPYHNIWLTLRCAWLGTKWDRLQRVFFSTDEAVFIFYLLIWSTYAYYMRCDAYFEKDRLANVVYFQVPGLVPCRQRQNLFWHKSKYRRLMLPNHSNFRSIIQKFCWLLHKYGLIHSGTIIAVNGRYVAFAVKSQREFIRKANLENKLCEKVVQIDG